MKINLLITIINYILSIILWFYILDPLYNETFLRECSIIYPFILLGSVFHLYHYFIDIDYFKIKNPYPSNLEYNLNFKRIFKYSVFIPSSSIIFGWFLTYIL